MQQLQLQQEQNDYAERRAMFLQLRNEHCQILDENDNNILKPLSPQSHGWPGQEFGNVKQIELANGQILQLDEVDFDYDNIEEVLLSDTDSEDELDMEDVGMNHRNLDDYRNLDEETAIDSEDLDAISEMDSDFDINAEEGSVVAPNQFFGDFESSSNECSSPKIERF